MGDVALDYHSPRWEEKSAGRGGWRIVIGVLCGICGSCAATFTFLFLLSRIWPTSNAPDKYLLPCYLIVGIAGFAGAWIAGHFRYWFCCGLFAAVAGVFGVMAMLSWMLAGWHG
jgi:hypothetical protein